MNIIPYSPRHLRFNKCSAKIKFYNNPRKNMLIRKIVNRKQDNGYKCSWRKDNKGYKIRTGSNKVTKLNIKKDGRKCYLI